MVDALRFCLTGGTSNSNPDASLGGLRSTTRNRGLGAIVGTSIPALRIDDVTAACGEGQATLVVDGSGNLTFTPPDGLPGSPTFIAAGLDKVVVGSDSSKGIRVHCDPVLSLTGEMFLTLVHAIDGAISHGNLTSAQRASGVTTYRAIMLHAPGDDVKNVKLWLPPVSGAQATFSLAIEDAPLSVIQTIANEFTAPAAVVFSTPTTEGGALLVGTILAGHSKGLWIRRVFPVGVVAAREDVQLAVKYQGA